MADFQTATEARGLALPATRGPGGYFESKGPVDVAWGNLLNAIFVPIGGRFMRRSYGSALRDQVFEPTADTDIAAFAIRDVANRLLPDVTVTQVFVRAVQKGLEITVVFRLNRDRDRENRQQVLIPKSFISPGAA